MTKTNVVEDFRKIWGQVGRHKKKQKNWKKNYLFFRRAGLCWLSSFFLLLSPDLLFRGLCVQFCNHNNLFVFFLLFLRIQYIPLSRCCWFTHNPVPMPVFPFYPHFYYLDCCVCVSKHTYVFPSSSMSVHIYRHIYMYDLCCVFILTLIFLFFSLFFRNWIDTCVRVRMDIMISLLISSSSDSLCISTLQSVHAPSCGSCVYSCLQTH